MMVPAAAAWIGHGLLSPVDLAGDALVFVSDLVHVVELVDEVGEARGREEDRDRVGVVGLVHRDEARIEPANRLPVLLTEERQSAALELEELRQPREFLAVEREVLLEGGEAVV